MNTLLVMSLEWFRLSWSKLTFRRLFICSFLIPFNSCRGNSCKATVDRAKDGNRLELMSQLMLLVVDLISFCLTVLLWRPVNVRCYLEHCCLFIAGTFRDDMIPIDFGCKEPAPCPAQKVYSMFQKTRCSCADTISLISDMQSNMKGYQTRALQGQGSESGCTLTDWSNRPHVHHAWMWQASISHQLQTMAGNKHVTIC